MEEETGEVHPLSPFTPTTELRLLIDSKNTIWKHCIEKALEPLISQSSINGGSWGRHGLCSGVCHFKLRKYQQSAFPGRKKKIHTPPAPRPMPLLITRPMELEATFLWSKIDKRYPGWFSSVDWAWACEPKGRWFNSQSGHIPGLPARSPVRGVREAPTHWCFSPSLLPCPLSRNKYNLKNKKRLMMT